MSRVFPAPPGLTEHDLREISKKGYMLPGGGATTVFSSMATAPAVVHDGGALVYTGGDFLYAFRGWGTTAFWRYSISANSWTVMATAPAPVASGGALVYTGGDFLYAFQGGNTTAFWRTTILAAPLFLAWRSWMR